jgi:hypothetical protein
MEGSIQRLREELEPFLSELATLQYRHGAGLSQTLALDELLHRYPAFGRPETFRQVKEAAVDPKASAEERRRLRLLLEFVATQVEEAIAAPAVDQVAALEATGTVQVGQEQVGFSDALLQLCREPRRERRAAVERALGAFLDRHLAPYARRREAASAAAARLGYPDYVSLRAEVSGIAYADLAQQCQQVLSRTEDAYRDLLGYVLRKLSLELRPGPGGGARRHDLQHAASAPWMAGCFPPSELVPQVARCLTELGLGPDAARRIRLDTEERTGKSHRAFVAEVRVPEEIRLVLRPSGGLDDYFALLHEYGHAQHSANISAALPVEDRRLGDASVTEGFAYLFDHLLIDERWLKRYLGLAQTTAREAARLAAFNNLALLRRYCAKLCYELELYAGGSSGALAEAYVARQQSALLVSAQPGFFLYDVDPQLYAARYLRAWGLEAALHQQLTSRYDEDFWRNPAAGQFLQGLFARGQGEDAAALCRELGGQELGLAPAGDRLVAVLNR